MKVKQGKTKVGRFIMISEFHGESKEECRAAAEAIEKWLDEDKEQKETTR